MVALMSVSKYCAGDFQKLELGEKSMSYNDSMLSMWNEGVIV